MDNNNLQLLNNRLNVRAGAVIVQDKPYYYVELVSDGVDQLIIAYELSKRGLAAYEDTNNPNVLAKASALQVEDIDKYDTSPKGSPLSRYLGVKLGDKNKQHKMKTFYKPAIFVSQVVNGTDSITDNFGPGFMEMKPTRIAGPINDSYQKLEPTGVFIGLNNIKWIKNQYDFKRWQGYIEPIFETYNAYFNTLGMFDG
jgi:hypothetical protein